MRKNASHRTAARASMTVAAYARHRKVSRRAVYDALQAGRIARLPDGTIDIVAADRAWTANTMPHVGGKMHSKGNAVDHRAVEAGEAEARRLLGLRADKVLSFNDARRAFRFARPGVTSRRGGQSERPARGREVPGRRRGVLPLVEGVHGRSSDLVREREAGPV